MNLLFRMKFYVVNKNGYRTYVCDLCRLAFAEFKKLVAHRSVHSSSHYMVMLSKPSNRGAPRKLDYAYHKKGTAPIGGLYPKSYYKEPLLHKEVLKCEWCLYTTLSIYYMGKHIAGSHKKFYPLAQKKLRERQLQDNSSRPCDERGKYMHERALQDHKKEHTIGPRRVKPKKNKLPFNCQWCTYTTPSQYCMHKHKVDFHGELYLPAQKPPKKCEPRDCSYRLCDQCGELMFEKDLQDHRKKHHIGCGTVNTETHYIQPLRDHCIEPCKYCSYTAPTEIEMLKHLQEHIEHFPYRCDSCNDKFHTKPELDNHSATSHTKKVMSATSAAEFFCTRTV